MLRGLAASLVVFNHLRAMEVKYLAGSHLLSSFHMGGSGVDLFFVISGFIIALVSRDLFGSRQTAAYFFKKRLIRVVPPYWFFTTLVLLAYLYNPAWVNSSAQAPPNILASYLFIPTGTYFLLLVGWTLSFEMYFYLAWSLLMLGKRAAAIKILSAFFLGSVVLGLVHRFESPILHMMTEPLILEFVLGVLICQLYFTVKIKNSLWPGFVLALGAVLLGSNHFLEYGAHRFFEYGLPAAMVFFGVVFLEKNHDIRWPRPLVALGDASYSLYLSHVLIISALGRLYRALGLTSVMPGLVLIIGAYLACCVFAWFSYKWLELPTSRVLNRVFAKRPALAARAAAVS